MLLEETLDTTTSTLPHFNSLPPMSSAGGTVIMIASGSPPSVTLEGGDTGWSTEGSTLTLRPTKEQPLPVWYNFTFALVTTPEGYSLFGIEIYSSESAAAFFPAAPDGTVALNFVNNLAPGDKSASFNVGYVLKAKDGSLIPVDPTITFDPQT